MCIGALAAQGIFVITVLILRKKKKQQKALAEARAAAAAVAATADGSADGGLKGSDAALDSLESGKLGTEPEVALALPEQQPGAPAAEPVAEAGGTGERKAAVPAAPSSA